MADQWEYKFLGGNSVKEFIERLNEAGKEGWDAVNHARDSGRVSVLLKRQVQVNAFEETKPDLWADDPNWPKLPKAAGTEMVDWLRVIRPNAIVPTDAYISEEELTEVATRFPNNIYFIDRTRPRREVK